MWVRQHKKILSIVHVPSLKRVYVGLSNGSVFMYYDELPQGTTTGPLSCLSLEPLAEHSHPTQTSACLLVVPARNSLDGGASNSTDRSDKPTGGSYEIWVGQKGSMITILDAETLQVVQFIQNELDLSTRPSYVAYLSYAHLVCGVNTEQLTTSKLGGETRLTASSNTCVSVYGALYHGQYVTRWNAETKQAIESFNCREHLGLREGADACTHTHTHTHAHTHLHTHTHTHTHLHTQNAKYLLSAVLTFNFTLVLRLGVS